jgi:hypothetical protein
VLKHHLLEVALVAAPLLHAFPVLLPLLLHFKYCIPLQMLKLIFTQTHNPQQRAPTTRPASLPSKQCFQHDL